MWEPGWGFSTTWSAGPGNGSASTSSPPSCSTTRRCAGFGRLAAPSPGCRGGTGRRCRRHLRGVVHRPRVRGGARATRFSTSTSPDRQLSCPARCRPSQLPSATRHSTAIPRRVPCPCESPASRRRSPFSPSDTPAWARCVCRVGRRRRPTGCRSCCPTTCPVRRRGCAAGGGDNLRRAGG